MIILDITKTESNNKTIIVLLYIVFSPSFFRTST